MLFELCESLDEGTRGVLGEPWPRGVRGAAAGVDAKVSNAFFLDGDIVKRATIRDDGVQSAQSCLADEVAHSVFAAAFLVRGDDHAERDAGVGAVEIGKKSQHDGERAFHVARAGSVEAAVLEIGAVKFEIRVLDDVEVTDHENIGVLVIRREDDEGLVAAGFVDLEPDAGQGFEVVAEEGKGAGTFLRRAVGAGDEDEIAGEGDEAVGEFGGHGSGSGVKSLP